MNDILIILQTALLIVVIVAMTLIVARRLRSVMYAVFSQRVPTLAGFTSNVVQLLVVVAGLVLIIHTVGINTAVILAVVAIFTAGVSLALDGSVRDLIATAKLLTYGYYKIGDVVTLAGHTGQIVDITAFSTILETATHDRVIIANKETVDTIIMNHTAAKIQVVSIDIPISEMHDRHQVVALLTAVAECCPDRLTGTTSEPNIFHELTPDFEKYTVTVTIPRSCNKTKVASWLSLEAANKLNECGIRTGRILVNRV